MQNIDSDLIRGNIDTIILKTMLDGDKYGLDIIKEVESRSNGTYELKQPTLYSCLKRLENQELISSYWLDSDIGGKRHYYKLTEKGRDFFAKKQEEWSRSKFIIDNLLSSFNYEDYRLVKKDDYEKIIEGKQAEFENQVISPISSGPDKNEQNMVDEQQSQNSDDKISVGLENDDLEQTLSKIESTEDLPIETDENSIESTTNENLQDDQGDLSQNDDINFEITNSSEGINEEIFDNSNLNEDLTDDFDASEEIGFEEQSSEDEDFEAHNIGDIQDFHDLEHENTDVLEDTKNTEHDDSDHEGSDVLDSDEDAKLESTQKEQIKQSDTQKPERRYFVQIDDNDSPYITDVDDENSKSDEDDYDASDSDFSAQEEYKQISEDDNENRTALENNILSKLRMQDEEEITTYVGDQNSYINHLNQNDKNVVQDDMFNSLNSQNDIIDDKLDEFNEAVKNLNNFSETASVQDESNYATAEETETTLSFLQEEIEQDKEPEFEKYLPVSEENNEESNISEEPTKTENQDSAIVVPELDLAESDDENQDYMSKLNEFDAEFDNMYNDSNSNTSFLSSHDNEDYSPVSVQKSNADFANLNSSLNSDYKEEFDLSSNFPTFDDNQTSSSLEELNFEEFNSDNHENKEDKLYSIDEIVSRNVSATDFDPVLKNNTSYDGFNPKYTGENYKEKLSDLSIYSINTDKKQQEPERTLDDSSKAKDIAELKAELEQEGIKVQEYKKYNSSEQAEKSYLLVNKINFINSLILLFGYIFVLSGVFIILNNTSFKDTLNFSFKYFVFGFIPFIAIALVYGIIFLINPYKKVPAKYAPQIMLFISTIITIQLLLITYCVNLQLGFYSFSQLGYNHLLWLIPTIVSVSPILYTVIYMTLFYSKNFNV